jgi:hypothetical protein
MREWHYLPLTANPFAKSNTYVASNATFTFRVRTGTRSLDLPASSSQMPARRHVGEMEPACLTCLELTSYPTQATMPAVLVYTFLPSKAGQPWPCDTQPLRTLQWQCSATAIASIHRTCLHTSFFCSPWCCTYYRIYCLSALIQPLYCTLSLLQGFREFI